MRNIPKTCICCKRIVEVKVSELGYSNWNKGRLIQDALQELTDDEREILISGICGRCFDNLSNFGEEEGEQGNGD